MSWRLMMLFLVVIGLLSAALPAAAQDPRPVDPPIPCCGVFTDPAWLKIDYQRVQVDIRSQIASTSVDMQFANEGEGLAEGT
ncbi:MAG: hypothetical protein ACOCYT_03285, partial [Chloroflexota bacterium]